jgi:hypothetical protein
VAKDKFRVSVFNTSLIQLEVALELLSQILEVDSNAKLTGSMVQVEINSSDIDKTLNIFTYNIRLQRFEWRVHDGNYFCDVAKEFGYINGWVSDANVFREKLIKGATLFRSRLDQN